jgi:hypothetical protein
MNVQRICLPPLPLDASGLTWRLSADSTFDPHFLAKAIAVSGRCAAHSHHHDHDHGHSPACGHDHDHSSHG